MAHLNTFTTAPVSVGAGQIAHIPKERAQYFQTLQPTSSQSRNGLAATQYTAAVPRDQKVSGKRGELWEFSADEKGHFIVPHGAHYELYVFQGSLEVARLQDVAVSDVRKDGARYGERFTIGAGLKVTLTSRDSFAVENGTRCLVITQSEGPCFVNQSLPHVDPIVAIAPPKNIGMRSEAPDPHYKVERVPKGIYARASLRPR